MRGLIGFFFNGLALNLQLNQTPIKFVDDLGLGVNFNFDFGCCLVDQVNSFVRQKPVGDVPMAELCRRYDGGVGDVHTVVHLVLFLQAPQNGNGLFHRRFAHQHLLKPALKRGVFFDVFAVLVQGGGTNAVELPTCQGGLEHIARVYGPLGLTCPHHGVEFVNKQNNATLILRHFFKHSL